LDELDATEEAREEEEEVLLTWGLQNCEEARERFQYEEKERDG